MDSLPTETILHIISFLSGKDLKHFSLVSTRFTPLAQPVLFERVHLIDLGKISSSTFVNFVDVVIKSPRIAKMIKRLQIGPHYDKSRHHQPFVQLLEQVHNIRELMWHSQSDPPSFPFRPYQFPQLHRIQWSLQGTGTDILHTLLPYSHVTDLSLLRCPEHLQSKVAFAAFLKPHPSKWIDNLVKYMGCSYPIETLSEDAKLLHFGSTNALSEETLRGLASKRLLSLHVNIILSRQSPGEHCLPPLLLPPLFPNLQSVACLSLQLGPGILCAFQDPANDTVVACLQQLRDLRRVVFVLVDPTQKWSSYDRFVTDLQQFIQEHSLRLERIYIQRGNRGRYWFGKYTKQMDSRGDLVGWVVEHYRCERLAFVDRW